MREGVVLAAALVSACAPSTQGECTGIESHLSAVLGGGREAAEQFSAQVEDYLARELLPHIQRHAFAAGGDPQGISPGALSQFQTTYRRPFSSPQDLNDIVGQFRDHYLNQGDFDGFFAPLVAILGDLDGAGAGLAESQTLRSRLGEFSAVQGEILAGFRAGETAPPLDELTGHNSARASIGTSKSPSQSCPECRRSLMAQGGEPRVPVMEMFAVKHSDT